MKVYAPRVTANISTTTHLRQVSNSENLSVIHSRVPFAMPDIDQAEIDAVAAAMASGWVTSGPEMAAFEREFADFVGAEVDAVATNSATAGLHLALEACGVGPGDEVIVPTWTFTATAEVVRYVGATPVLVDIEPDSLNLDLETVLAAITERTKAVIPVHMAGLSVDMPALWSITAPRGLAVIEDAAHTLPTVGSGRMVGSTAWSTAAVFSFYANKAITTGEGGMVTTRDRAMAARMRTMRLHGIDRDVFSRYGSRGSGWAYDVVAPGFKYNMPDTAAAMGRVQLRRAMELRNRRATIAARYRSELGDLPLRLPPDAAEPDLHAWHLFVIRLTQDTPVHRDRFIELMAAAGITCSVHFIPLHRHTYWRGHLNCCDDDYPRASDLAERVVSLPLFSAMTTDQVDRVIRTVRDILR